MSILLGALLIAANPTTADAAAVAPAAKAEKKICRVDTTESTSRLRKKVCLTQTEWDRKQAGTTANDIKNIGGR